MILHIDTSEVHQLADDLRVNSGQLPAAAARAMTKVGFDMQAHAQVLCPVDTGNLRSSISLDSHGLSFDLGPTAEYGDYVERGVPHPFVIRAKAGGTLHFVIDGQDVFAKSVTHPPMAPQPYLGPAFDAGLPQAEDALADLGEQVLSRV